MAELVARTRAPVRERAARSATGWAATCASRCGSRGSAGSRSSTASRRPGATSSGSGRSTARSTRPRSPGGPGGGPGMSASVGRTGHAPERDQLLLRLPHPARGEAPGDLRALRLLPRGRRLRRRGGRRGRGGPRGAGWTRWIAATPGSPETELGRELAEAVARFPIPRACFEDIVAGCRMDLTTRRYATLRRPPGLLRARGLGGGPRLDRDLRLRRPAHARVRGGAGPRAPAHQHPARRRGGRRAGPALPPARGPRPLRGDRGRAARRRARPRGPRPPGLDRLLAFEADRARSHYAAAASALPERDRRSMLAAEIMGAIYRAVLEEWARAATRSAAPGCSSASRARSGSRCGRSRGCTGAYEGRRRRGRLRRLRRGHRAAGAAARGRAPRAARRPRRAGHLVPRRGHRRGRGQRHPPHARGLRLDPRPRAAGGGLRPGRSSRTTSGWSGWTRRARRRSTARRSARRSTCWPGSSACACRSR